MMTETEYIETVERYEKAMLGDMEQLGPLFDKDLPRLLADWRGYQTVLRELTYERDVLKLWLAEEQTA